jgi:hypothetical protein
MVSLLLLNRLTTSVIFNLGMPWAMPVNEQQTIAKKKTVFLICDKNTTIGSFFTPKHVKKRVNKLLANPLFQSKFATR